MTYSKSLYAFAVIMALLVLLCGLASSAHAANSSKEISFAEFVAHDNSVACLTRAIYEEARGEPMMGKIAVGFSIINRTRSEQFPDSVCSVIAEKTKTRQGEVWQYPWFSRALGKAPEDEQALHAAEIVAQKVLRRTVSDPTRGAHSFCVPEHCRWHYAALKKTVRIGGHDFFTDPF